MIRDAAAEAARALVGAGLVAASLLLTAAPGIGGMALAAGARATLDLALLLVWVTAVGGALLLGSRLHGDGLRAYGLPALGPARWVATRTAGAAAALAALVVGLGAVGLALAPVRGAGADLLVGGAGIWLEAVVVCQLTGLLRVWARAGVAAWAAAVLAGLGHLHGAWVQAVAVWGWGDAVAGLLMVVPAFEAVDVQGALIAGRPVDVGAWLRGAAALAGWSVLLGALTVEAAARREPPLG